MKSKAIIESSLIPFSMQPIPNNPLFSKSKIYVMYHGENRNGSNITKENVERNLATIKNIPIIGEFDKNSDNFKGHGGKLELSEDGIEFIHTTKPLGVVPESATTYWEIVKDKKGIEREYLVVDGAYMWNRYEKEVETLKEENFGQSMELEVFDGEWVQDDRIFDIKDFAFSALCILGIDRDGSGHVEPAFGDAKIITYSKSELQDELSEMLKEFKYSLSNDAELGSKEDNELNLEDLLKKYSITVEDLEEKSIKYSEMTIEELEQEIEKSFSEEDTSDEESKEDEKNASDEEGEGEDEEEQEDNSDEEEEKGKEDEEDEEPNQFELEVQSLRAENEALKAEIEGMQSEIAEFKKNDHEREANSILERFKADYDLDESDVSEISIHDFSLEQLESKLFEIVGRKIKTQKEDFGAKTKVKFNLDKEEKQDKPVYDSLFQSIKK